MFCSFVGGDSFKRPIKRGIPAAAFVPVPDARSCWVSVPARGIAFSFIGRRIIAPVSTAARQMMPALKVLKVL